jgi:predicted DNA-binding protein (UPF0251 family)
MGDLEDVTVTVDELEAIRLADLEGLYQEEAAKKMDVSRQTFGRIVESAHRKIAEALVTGKALKIEGGEIEMTTLLRKFRCTDCDQPGKSLTAPAGPRNARRAKAVTSTAKRAAGDSEAEGEEDSGKDSAEDAERGNESWGFRAIPGIPIFMHLRGRRYRNAGLAPIDPKSILRGSVKNREQDGNCLEKMPSLVHFLRSLTPIVHCAGHREEVNACVSRRRPARDALGPLFLRRPPRGRSGW